MNEISRDLVTQALYNIDCPPKDEHNPDGVNVRDDYSGRGMYRDTCFGIDFDSDRDAFRFIASITAVLIADDETDGEGRALDLADEATTDSMGRGMILYFPGWKLVG